MGKIFISILLMVGIVTAPIQVKSQEIENLEGQIIPLQKDQKAPYTGILLDPVAAAKINTDKKYSLLEGQLKMDYELKKQAADYNLELLTLQASYSSLKESSESIIKIKTEEISRLQEIATESPNDYAALWVSLGIAVGVLMSIGVFYAAVEAAK
jgi:hypothetical protein